MRDAFVRTLSELAARDSRILLLTADLGYMFLERFSEKYPKRFFNAGVAEQNMVGMATGLAEAGFIPFVYSMATFASLRPFEFIRNGPVLHRLPVRIIGVGGGFEYGPAGITHFGLEDIGVLRTQPALTLIAPADHEQARNALLATWDLPGPVYYRLGKDDRTVVSGLDGRFELGRVQAVFAGKDMVFIAMGNIAGEVVRAASILRQEGVSCGALVVASMNPPPVADLVAALKRVPLAVTAEEHYLNGGLGSLVSEIVAGKGIRCRVARCGVDVMPEGVSGSHGYLRRTYKLDADGLVRAARRALKRDKR